MRTMLQLSVLFVCAFLFLAGNQASGLTINTYYSVTIDSTINENIDVDPGGVLIINPGVTLILPSGNNVEVRDFGSLYIYAGSQFQVYSGSYLCYPNSYTYIDNGASLRFIYGVNLRLHGGVLMGNGGYIAGGVPTYSTTIQIHDGTVLQGDLNIRYMDVNIHDATWYINPTSSMTFHGGGTIKDPTGSNSHDIQMNGMLRFVNGNFSINTVAATRITGIQMYDGSLLDVTDATIFAVPNITAVEPTNIASSNSEWLFEPNQRIDTRGNIQTVSTKMPCYTPAIGWGGIYLHDGASTLTMEYTRVLQVNSAYAISLERTTGGVHLFDHCTISDPVTMFSGNGLQIIGLYSNSCDVMMECSYIQNFDNGIYVGYRGNLMMTNSELAFNNTGMYCYDSEHTNLTECGIHNNQINGLYYIGSMNNHLHECDVYDNATYQIYQDFGTYTPSDLTGANNNIYSTVGGPYLVVVYGGSNVDLSNCWWDAYPPSIGVEFDVSGGSNMQFPGWQWGPMPVSGYLSCGIQYPKRSVGASSAQPTTADISIYNYPNPFNPTTRIEYTLPEDMHAVLSVYTLNGQKLETLSNGYQSEGTHSVTFNATSYASGVYMYVLQTPLGNKHGLMMLTK